MQIHIIVAATRQGVIGKDNGMPWRQSADLKRFKALTMGHCLVMGRKTWESLPNAPLPGRPHIVISRNADYAVPAGVQLATSLEQAWQLCRDANYEHVFVIGGAEIFKQAEPMADVLHYTHLEADVPGDTYYTPDFAPFKMLESCPHPADERNDYPFSFRTYVRR